MDSHEIYVVNKLKRIASLIPHNSKVLDIGCEDAKIKDFLTNCEYYAIDIDKKQINNLIKQGVKAREIDLNKHKIPFESENFDYIILLDILEHILDPQKLLRECKKRLNPKGRLIICLPNDYHILNKIRFLLNKNLTEYPFAPYGHLHYFPIKSGEDFIKKNGIGIFKKGYIPPSKPTIIPYPIKKFLAEKFPQSFTRDVFYVTY